MKIKNRLFTSLLIIGIVSSAQAYDITCQIGKVCQFPAITASHDAFENLRVELTSDFGTNYTCTMSVNSQEPFDFVIGGSPGLSLIPAISNFRANPSVTFSVVAQFATGNHVGRFNVILPWFHHASGLLVCYPSY